MSVPFPFSLVLTPIPPPTCLQLQMEATLVAWCDQQWKLNKVLTRGIIFRKALEIFLGFCGGKKNKKCFYKTKKWFYQGFKYRNRLSKRRISSTGQKLPKDWKAKVDSIVRRVSTAQMPQQRVDGTYHGGVSDAMMGNTDQVPVYMEDHSKSTWGRREDHERQTVSTAGKDKDRFTVQLTVFKNGRKVSPRVIGLFFQS